MFCETCDRCGTRQLFGYRRLAKLDNVTRGVMALTWRCVSCDGFSVTRVGSAVSAGGHGGR